MSSRFASGLSPTERRWIVLLSLIGFLSRVALAFRSTWQISSRPYIDDAFYLFSCAKHLALGHGFTVDGLHATNGVQPLICLLYAPGFLLGDDLGLRLTFLVGALVQAASTIAIASLLARMRKGEADSLRASAPFFAALLWTVIAPLADQNGSGLETGLVALLILCDLIYYASIREHGWNAGRAAVFGLLLGLTVLARVDSALFVIAFVIVEWRHLKFVLLAAFVALAVSTPWWIYGYVTFGSLMPMSGAAESLGMPIIQNLSQSVLALFDMLTIFFNHAWYQTNPQAESLMLIVLLAMWISVISAFDLFTKVKEQYSFASIQPLFLFCGFVFIYYNFFFSAPHFMTRYLHPVRILILIAFTAMLPSIMSIRSNTEKVWKVILPCVVMTGLAFSVYRYVNEFTADPKSDFYPLAQWATAQGGRMGCDQSGQAAFFASNVINLDGKVNYDALEARKRGAIGEYIAHEQIEYLADWKPLVEDLAREARKYGAHYQLYDSIRFVQIYRRVN